MRVGIGNSARGRALGFLGLGEDLKDGAVGVGQTVIQIIGRNPFALFNSLLGLRGGLRPSLRLHKIPGGALYKGLSLKTVGVVGGADELQRLCIYANLLQDLSVCGYNDILSRLLFSFWKIPDAVAVNHKAVS